MKFGRPSGIRIRKELWKITIVPAPGNPFTNQGSGWVPIDARDPGIYERAYARGRSTL
jgi:hypothetical protein